MKLTIENAFKFKRKEGTLEYIHCIFNWQQFQVKFNIYNTDRLSNLMFIFVLWTGFTIKRIQCPLLYSFCQCSRDRANGQVQLFLNLFLSAAA